MPMYGTSGSRQNIYPKGSYEGDEVIAGDNGLKRAVGRGGHRRPVRGLIRRIIANPAVNPAGGATPSTMGVTVLAANTTDNPQTINTPEGEQFIFTEIASATANDEGFFLCRFLLNGDVVSDWLTPAPFKLYNVAAAPTAALGVSFYTGAGPIIYDLAFDQVQFALIPGSVGGAVQVDGMWATNGARINAGSTGAAI